MPIRPHSIAPSQQLRSVPRSMTLEVIHWLPGSARTRSEILSAEPMVGCNLQDSIGTHPICPDVFPWFQKIYISMTDPWRMQKSSELFTKGARLTWVQQTRPWRWSAFPWLVKSNRHLPLQISWDRQSVSSDIPGISGDMSNMSMIFNEKFIYRYGFYMFLPDSILGCWIKTISCPNQCTATSILLRQMVGVFSCILTAKHSQNPVFRCCFVDKKGSCHHTRKTVVEGCGR